MKKIGIFVIGLLCGIRRSLFPESVCRFYPSCSRYAVYAIYKHGVFKGMLRALVRILRCGPFYTEDGEAPLIQ